MKNYKGGYKLIDLEKVDMLEIEVGVVIKGIHKAIESSYGKPLLLTGIVIDGVEKNDVYIEELKVVDGSFVFKAYGYEITIDDEDNVEAVKIHVPVVKSVTSAAESKDIDIQDGDEYLLSSTKASTGTGFHFPSGCLLLMDGNVADNILSGYASSQEDSYIQCPTGVEIKIKRIGGIILVTSTYEL